MAKVWPQTLWIDQDEPCFNLSELNRLGPNNGPYHRWQVIIVVRNDSLHEYTVDLGLAEYHPYSEFRIPGGGIDDDGTIWIEHTVAELQDIADTLRGRKEEPRAQPVSAEFWDRYYKMIEERPKVHAHQSTFGSLVTVRR